MALTAKNHFNENREPKNPSELKPVFWWKDQTVILVDK